MSILLYNDALKQYRYCMASKADSTLENLRAEYRRAFPDYSEAQIDELVARLDRYSDILWDIANAVAADPEKLKRFQALSAADGERTVAPTQPQDPKHAPPARSSPPPAARPGEQLHLPL